MLKQILNKWQFLFLITKDYSKIEAGWRVFKLGLVNLKSIPDNSFQLRKENYRGFIIQFRFWFPLEKI